MDNKFYSTQSCAPIFLVQIYHKAVTLDENPIFPQYIIVTYFFFRFKVYGIYLVLYMFKLIHSEEKTSPPLIVSYDTGWHSWFNKCMVFKFTDHFLVCESLGTIHQLSLYFRDVQHTRTLQGLVSLMNSYFPSWLDSIVLSQSQ